MPIRVLHVDDNPSILDMCAATLEREDDYDLEVETETNPELALESLEQNDYDIVLSDYEMPEMDGLEFLDEVRDEYDEIPFILFTGKGSEEIASEAISRGVTDYLQKDTGIEVYDILANRINEYVERHEEIRQYQKLFQNLDDPAFRYQYNEDDRPIIFDVNQHFVEIFGYSEEEAVGRDVDELIVPPEKKEEAEEIDQRVREGEKIDAIIQRKTRDGMKDFKFRNVKTGDGMGFAIYEDVEKLINKLDDEFILEKVVGNMDRAYETFIEKIIDEMDEEGGQVLAEKLVENLGEEAVMEAVSD